MSVQNFEDSSVSINLLLGGHPGVSSKRIVDDEYSSTKKGYEFDS